MTLATARPTVPQGGAGPGTADGSTDPWLGMRPAERQHRPRWRDLRLVLGAAIVLASMALGASIIGGADQTTPVWAAAGALVPGTEVRAEDLERRDVRIVGGENPYIAGEAPIGYVVTRAVAAGELLPASAVATFDEVSQDVRLVTISVPRAAAPPDLSAGDAVDVWMSGRQSAADEPAALLAERVPVAAVPDTSSAFGSVGADQTVVLAVARGSSSGTEFTDLLSRLVTGSRDGDVVLALVPGPPR